MQPHTHTIAAGEFKARCLQIMEDVNATHIPVTITKRGKPVATLIPFEEGPTEIFGCMQGTIRIKGDVISPIGVKWDANE